MFGSNFRSLIGTAIVKFLWTKWRSGSQFPCLVICLRSSRRTGNRKGKWSDRKWENGSCVVATN